MKAEGSEGACRPEERERGQQAATFHYNQFVWEKKTTNKQTDHSGVEEVLTTLLIEWSACTVFPRLEPKKVLWP